jgi:type II secretory pathway pseudopilin PulG
MSLVELMIAILVLAVGMAGIAILFAGAGTSARRNKVDTNSTLVAKMVLEQISAQDPSQTSSILLTDCSGVTSTINTAPGGANVQASSGNIDFSQSYSSVPTGYAMKYVDCATGQTTSYDVRWNIVTVSTNAVSGGINSRMITVAAHQMGSTANAAGGNGVFFAMPVTLRTVGGPTQ